MICRGIDVIQETTSGGRHDLGDGRRVVSMNIVRKIENQREYSLRQWPVCARDARQASATFGEQYIAKHEEKL